MSQTAARGGDRPVLGWLLDAGFAPTMIVIIGVYMTFKSDVFLTSGNLQNILLQSSFLAIAAFGMTFVIIAAELDLSQGSSIALIGVVTADVMTSQQSIWLGLLAGLATGLAIGLFNGVVTAVFGVPSFITTLGLLVMARGLAREITAGNTVGGLPDSWKDFWSTELVGLRMPIWVAVAFGIVCHVILRYTRFGLHVYAVGGNAVAASRSGIHVMRVRIGVFVLAGVALTVSGWTLLGRVNAGQPNAAVLTELFAVAAVVLGGTNLFGGRGSIPRTAAGVLLIGVIRNSLNLLSVSSNMQDVWLGLVFILAMTSQRIQQETTRISRWLRRRASITDLAPETGRDSAEIGPGSLRAPGRRPHHNQPAVTHPEGDMETMRHTRRAGRWLALLLAIGLVAASCGNDSDGDASDDTGGDNAAADAGGGGDCDETYDVAYANLATFILYFRELEEGLRTFGEANCWNFTAADAAYVIEDQISQIEDFVTQGVDLIIASPGDREALVAAYQVAADAGIPILSTGDNVVDESLEIGFIGTHWFDEGTRETQWIIDQIGGEGQIARIGGPGASEYVEERKRGFEELIAANPGVDVVFNQSANAFTQEEGLRLAQDALTANPDLQAIWADSDALALGAAQAVEEAGIDQADIFIAGTDGEPAVFDQIRDGTGVDMTIALQGFKWGQQTAAVAHAYLTGGSTGEEHFIQAPTIVVDAETIEGKTNEDLR